MTLADLRGGEEVVGGNALPVDREALEDALQTGLFTLRGTNRLHWAHRTYGEFLAAWYVTERGMELGQVMTLLAHPSDPEGKLVPQLHETAAWIAGMHQDVFREIVRREPEVLLRSEAATADSSDRAALVAALLELYEGTARRWHSLETSRPRYDRLAHPGLAVQLREYLQDGSRAEAAREFAVDIAEACQLREVQGELADLALGGAAPLDLRVAAADALARMGDSQTRARLLPLAIGALPEDALDQLKGSALRAVWPEHLTAEALLSCLTPPRRADVIGTYQLFLYGAANDLKADNLPLALRWVREQENGSGRSWPTYVFQRLANSIVVRAWDALAEPGVAPAFAGLAVERFGKSEPLIRDPYGVWGSAAGAGVALANEPARRHMAVEALLPLLTDPDRQWTWLVYSRPRLVTPEDYPWLLEQLRQHRQPTERRLLARLTVGVLDWTSAAQIDAALEAAESDDVLREALKPYVQPVDLASVEARGLKEAFAASAMGTDRPRQLISPPPRERVEVFLARSEAGEPQAWWLLARQLTLAPDSDHYVDELEPDVTRLLGWEPLDAPTRRRVVEAARRYLPAGDPQTGTWLDPNKFSLPALAGYKARRLVQDQAPGELQTLPPQVWAKWAPVVLTYPNADSEPNRVRHRQLLRLVYRQATDRVLDTLKHTPRGDSGEYDVLAAVDALGEDGWDDRLANAVLAIASDTASTSPWLAGGLLSHLLSHRHAGARAVAESLVAARSAGEGDAWKRAVEAGQGLFMYADSTTWPKLWVVFQEDPAFGRELVERFASHVVHTEASGARLSEEQLADLYLWAVEQYPHADDPDYGGKMVELDDRDFAAQWRDGVLLHLRQAGTTAAADAIRRIAGRHPQLEWLQLVTAEAEMLARQRTWQAPKARDVVALAQRPERRLIQNGSQLLDVLQEALARFERDLHAETPLVPFLWDEQRDGTWRPKDENYLSDLVKLFLERELRSSGIVIGREVEIRRRVAPDALGGAAVRWVSGGTRGG